LSGRLTSPSSSAGLSFQITSDANGDAPNHDANRDASEGRKIGDLGRSGPKDLRANRARNANRPGSPSRVSGFGLGRSALLGPQN